MAMGNYYDDYTRVKEIAYLLDRAWELFTALPVEVRGAIQAYHNDGFTVGHCARWGAQNAREIADDWHNVVSELGANGDTTALL
jgi:hypothetical protein